MSVERFLLVNLAVDIPLLAAVARCCGAFRARRIAAAALLCSVYSLVAVRQPRPWAGAPVQLAVLAAVARILSARRGARACAFTALLLACGMLSAGGAALLLSPVPRSAGQAILPALLGIAALEWILKKRHPRRGAWEVDVALRAGDGTARFSALIDTGNRLREPLSGQPVLIAEEGLLAGVLPRDACRSVAFGALGGNGRLQCFRPSDIWIERGGRRVPAPEVWVAVFPGRLPGDARALAPCEFVDCLT